jgi:hypothetical protein
MERAVSFSPCTHSTHLKFMINYSFTEFWSISSGGSGKELSSPSDIETSKNFVSSGLGSQSSSSQNSLCESSKKYAVRVYILLHYS